MGACHRWGKLLESNGIVSGDTVCVDRTALNLEIQVFIEVNLTGQRKDDITAFENVIKRMPEVLKCHFTSGECDDLIRLITRNTAAYETLYRNRLSQIPASRR